MVQHFHSLPNPELLHGAAVCVPCALCSLFPAAGGWRRFVKPLTSVLGLLQLEKVWLTGQSPLGNLPHNSTKGLTCFPESDVSDSQRKTSSILRHLALASWQDASAKHFCWKRGQIASTNPLDPPMCMFSLRENCSASRDPLFLIKCHKIIICLRCKHWHSGHPLLYNSCLSAWLIIQLLLLQKSVMTLRFV